MKFNDEIKSTNPFRVPEGYFDNLTEKMMSAVRESGKKGISDAGEEKPVRKINLRPYLALAAAIAGFALVTTFMVRLVRNDRAVTMQSEDYGYFADLAAEEIDIYMIENELRNAEQADVTVWLEEETLEKEISTEAIIDYLTTEDVDLNDIYELLQ
jgi:hypothetical protein